MTCASSPTSFSTARGQWRRRLTAWAAVGVASTAAWVGAVLPASALPHSPSSVGAPAASVGAEEFSGSVSTVRLPQPVSSAAVSAFPASASSLLASTQRMFVPATSPVTISDSVTDPASFLSSEQHSSLRSALTSLGSAGVDTYVVLVPDLSGQAAISWCEASGNASRLSASSLLLVLAYEQRSITTCGNTGERAIADSAVVAALNQAKGILAKSNPLDASTAHEAVLAFVQSLTSAKAQGSSSSSGASSFASSAWLSLFASVPLIIGVGATAVFAMVVYIFYSQNKTVKNAEKSYRERAAARMADLGRRLLEADEIVRSSRDEIDFARAQFGSTSTQEFVRFLEVAESAVRSAFIDQQRLDGLPPMEQIREVDRIEAQLDQVIPPLVAERERVSDARNSQAHVGQQARELLGLVDEAVASLPSLRIEIDALAATYSRPVIASLLDNPEQAQPLLDHARLSATQAVQLADSAPAEAVRYLAVARQSLAVAQRYIDAVHTAPADLAQATEHVNNAVASITADIADVSRLGADPVAFAPLVRDAQQAVTSALAARDGRDDALAALEALRTAEDALDRALEPLRSAEESRKKQEDSASRMVERAQNSVSRAQQFVQMNRYGLPENVRATLAQAEGALGQARAALVAHDFARGTSSAREASALADAVLRTPVSQFPVGQGSLGQGTSRSGSNVAESILWSVLFSGALGGGHSRHHGSGGHSHSGGFGGGGFGGSSGSGHTSSF